MTEFTQRRKSKDVYLIVANDSEEFALSLRYTSRLATANNAHVGIMANLDEESFQHWSKVEDMMRKEIRENTEKKLWGFAKKVHELSGQIPVLYLTAGKAEDAVLKTLEEDENIKMLILSRSVSSGGPGVLVNYFTSKGLGKLKTPLVLVPGNISSDEIDALFNIEVTE